jgi:choline dehydrogenase
MVSAGQFDYVVVGSGSGGSVVARRLVDAGATVALLEAGSRDDNPAIHDPGRWPELPFSPQDWAWHTDPQEACHGRRLYWPRGKVLGGTSTMNGMAFIRGHPLDYDGWAYHGCPGWRWEDVLPLFKRLEDCDRGESEWRGAGGPVHVMTRYEPHPLIAAMQEACIEAGIPYNDDHNGGPELDGVGPSQLTIRDGRRQTAAVAYVEPIADHPNLTILTGARATSLRFDGTRCRGVEIAREGRAELVEAAAEVVLSAGTIESPRLLMLSGIGPAEELARHGIESRVDLPGVGRNLHDHLISYVIHASPIEVPAVRPGLQHHHVHLFWRSRSGLRVPDTQPVCFHLPLGADWFDLPEQGWTLTPGLVRTQSRGAIRLTSADPEAPLSLDPRALTVEADLDALAASVELMREVGRQPALAQWTAGELYPGPEVRTREEVRDYVRRSVGSYHHQVGTCKMGQDDDAVVDPELRVYGVEGLRVADASIMPFITTGNTNAPTFMIGEKASDLLLAAQGEEVASTAAV